MEGDPTAAPPPRVLIVMPEQWNRALLRAALREEGYDAIGSRGVREAFRVRPDDPTRGPVQLLIVDQDAISGAAATLAPALVRRLQQPGTVLIRRVTKATPAGEWDRVLQRPVSVEDVVTATRALLPLPRAARHPVDA